ncbi:unnamed protein product [Parascedosporium putredinis]|uniref:Uncharacterized protein n=1 Tax=Parascedosporium putredinis TaxID=1442378 RepID=A0A9P1M861_9PEZI|nr:unnamed protein product [Parascedosporium putredinis]CAI7988368.1 unnamed protein product [Parascedosporium putredinis]
MRSSDLTGQARMTEYASSERIPCGTATRHISQQNTSRRKSLRKAVLGREVVKDKLDVMEDLISGPRHSQCGRDARGGLALPPASDSDCRSEASDVTPWPTLDDPEDYGSNDEDAIAQGATVEDSPRLTPTPIANSALSYKSASTTDEDEGLHMPQPTTSSYRLNMSLSSGLDSFFTNRKSTSTRPPSQIARTPLSYSTVGLATTSVTSAGADWDYGETETWGWVVLIVTWFVFVTGMGSCFGVWSWAWDVGTTPYAPPELEDDPTLPIVGYYPALLILTCVMAWIWVMVAWVGMKYFRHAKISGD